MVTLEIASYRDLEKKRRGEERYDTKKETIIEIRCVDSSLCLPPSSPLSLARDLASDEIVSSVSKF